MMKIFLILILLLSNEALQKDILEMCANDQKLRFQWIASSDAEREVVKQEIVAIDLFHLPKLQKVAESYGWPGYSLIGVEGSHAFWLLIQHTPDQIFQNRCLELLEQAVLNEDASPIDLAYLRDRVNVHAGKKQIYGTQVNDSGALYPIEDMEHVNERRLAFGLSPLEEYLETIRKIMGSAT